MKYTKWIVVGIIALIAVIDVALLCMGLPTISRFILETSKQYPIAPFAVGVLIGHLFWPMVDKREDGK